MKKPTKEEYETAKAELLLRFAPHIYPCKKCGYPVANGWICEHCGFDDSED